MKSSRDKMQPAPSRQATRVFILIHVLLGLYQVEAAKPYINDPECPRRPHQITSDRFCLKKCRSDWNCKGKSRRCMCDGECGRTCVKPGMKCTVLPDIAHGHFYINPVNKFGARAQYSCDVGYVLTGEEERRCQGDGQWGGQQPTCQATATCSNPSRVPNGRHNGPDGQTVFPLGTKLYYTCQPGYIMDGYNNATCVSQEVWMGPKMHCSPIRCRRPVDIPHAKIDGSVFMYPSKVMYSCLGGYEIQGKPHRVCQENGLWSGTTPFCKPISCPKFPPITNGHVTTTGYSYGAEATFTCQYGYRIQGHRVRTCLKDGQWSLGKTTCELVDCGSPGPLYNGFYHGSPSTFGSTILFRCFGWATFEGDSNTTSCQVDGTWSNPVPHCWAKCLIPEVANGTLIGGDPGDKVEHGRQVQFKCHVGFEKKNDFFPVCQNGSLHEIPRCSPKPCLSRPTGIRDGMVRYYSVKHNDIAKYRCNTGFKMIGQNYSVCQYGKWQGEAPTCQPDYCKHPGNIKNGKILLVGVKGKFEYRLYVSTVEHTERIIYKCDNGYKRMGPHGATCVDGRWSPPNHPTCEPGQHRNLDRHVILYRGKRAAEDTVRSGG